MRKKVTYSLGDIFEFNVDNEGNKAYGRIVNNDQRLLFVEVYKLTPTVAEFDICHVLNATILFSVWSNDVGLKEGAWRIVGNIPVAGDFKMPDFWKREYVHNKIYLIRADGSQVEVTEEQIGDAQPVGIFGYLVIRDKYILDLQKIGMLPV